MLKIDNLSNEIDATAVVGGAQVNNMFIGQGGATVSQNGGGFLNAASVYNAPTAMGWQNNASYTSIYTQETANSVALFGSKALAVA